MQAYPNVQQGQYLTLCHVILLYIYIYLHGSFKCLSIFRILKNHKNQIYLEHFSKFRGELAGHFKRLYRKNISEIMPL